MPKLGFGARGQTRYTTRWSLRFNKTKHNTAFTEQPAAAQATLVLGAPGQRRALPVWTRRACGVGGGLNMLTGTGPQLSLHNTCFTICAN